LWLYYWDVPAKKYEGLAGKLLDGWAFSGITTYQTGFPIRITSDADNELMNSADFEYPGEPNQIAPFRGKGRRKTKATISITARYSAMPEFSVMWATRHAPSAVAGNQRD